MPFKSQAQKKFLFAKEPEVAKQWAKETPKGAKLPEKLKSKPSPSKKPSPKK